MLELAEHPFYNFIFLKSYLKYVFEIYVIFSQTLIRITGKINSSDLEK
jgi:hypothetical protein